VGPHLPLAPPPPSRSRRRLPLRHPRRLPPPPLRLAPPPRTRPGDRRWPAAPRPRGPP
jgi:hypothetical protein